MPITANQGPTSNEYENTTGREQEYSYSASSGFNFLDTIRNSKMAPNLGEEGDAYIEALTKELPRRLPGAVFIRLEDSGVYAAIYENFVIYVTLYAVSVNSAKLNHEQNVGTMYAPQITRFRLPVAALERDAHIEANEYYTAHLASELEKKFRGTDRRVPNGLVRCGNIVITDEDYGRIDQMLNFLTRNLANQSDVENRGPICGFSMIARDGRERKTQFRCESNTAALEQMRAANSPQSVPPRSDMNAVLTLRQDNQEDVDLAAVTAYVELVPDQLSFNNGSVTQPIDGYRPIIRITDIIIPSGEMGLLGLAITCALPVFYDQWKEQFIKDYQNKNIGLLVPNPNDPTTFDACKNAKSVQTLLATPYISDPGYALDVSFGRALPAIAYRLALDTHGSSVVTSATAQILSFAGIQVGNEGLVASDFYADYTGDIVSSGSRIDSRHLDIFEMMKLSTLEEARKFVARVDSPEMRSAIVAKDHGNSYRCMYYSKVQALNTKLINMIRSAIESAGIRVTTHSSTSYQQGMSFTTFVPDNTIGAAIGSPFGGGGVGGSSFNLSGF